MGGGTPFGFRLAPSRMRAQEPSEMKKIHPHAVFWEPLESDPTFVLRPMFGTKAVYLRGKIVLCFSTREEPWRGVLVATDQAQHASLIDELPALRAHPILPKWLYVPETSDDFEKTAGRLVQLVRKGDARIGVVPRSKSRRGKKTLKVEQGMTGRPRTMASSSEPAKLRPAKRGAGAQRKPQHIGKRRSRKSEPRDR